MVELLESLRPKASPLEGASLVIGSLVFEFDLFVNLENKIFVIEEDLLTQPPFPCLENLNFVGRWELIPIVTCPPFIMGETSYFIIYPLLLFNMFAPREWM